MDSDSVPYERLRDVVLGVDRGFALSKAMAQLSASDHPERESILARVLENPGERPGARTMAAIALGRIDTPKAEEFLIRNLSLSEEQAFPEVLRSLGQIGGPKALAAIDGLKLPEGHAARGAAAFGAALISHRLGLPGHDLPFPDASRLLKPPSTEARRIQVRKAEPENARAVLEDLKRYPYGIAYDTLATTRLDCAGEVNVFCVNREFAAPVSLAKAAERKALLAVGALESSESGNYSVSYLVLTRPGHAAGTLDILVTRCTGVLALAGHGRLTSGHLDFELRAVLRPGARAISLRGSLADGVMQTSEAVSATTLEARLTPQHIVVR